MTEDLKPYEFLKDRKRAWWERIYYPCWRVLWGGYSWYGGLLNPERWLYNRIKPIIWFFQRGWRDWADCDVWSISYHLSNILSQMLRRLADTTHGWPDTLERSNFETDEQWRKFNKDRFETFEEWQQWLRDKAIWFEWDAKDEDGISDDKGWIKEGMSDEERCKRIDEYFVKMKKFEEEVLPDFIKHWRSLWD